MSTFKIKVLIVTFIFFLSPAVPVFLLIACKAIYPYLLYQSALSSSCISSPSLILSLSIFLVAAIRLHCAGVAQTQNDKESPYLTSLMVEDLLFWAINRVYLLQGMQVSNLLIGCWRNIAPAVRWHVKQAKKYRTSHFTFSFFTICKTWLTGSISVPWRGGVMQKDSREVTWRSGASQSFSYKR